MKNNTTMGTLILKQGDFVLKYFKNSDIYFLFYKNSPIWDYKNNPIWDYKNNPIWDGEFNELFDTPLIDYVFERESDPKKATEFITELYKWGLSQQEAFEKLLDEVYGKEV